MKLRRRTIGIALAVLVVLLIFVGGLGTHLIVTTGLLRKWVNTDPEKLFLDYDSASAWVPGIIRIRGLAVRGSDDNVQWRFRMEAATISISLPDLLRRQVHATRVRAEGLVFRLREKVRKADFSQAHEKRVPEIPGFSDPPWKTFEPEPPPPSARERSRYWTIHVENLVADPAPDIWVELYRFRGHARVTGGFSLRPHTRASIGPAAVEFVSGRFELGPSESLLASASGKADCRFDEFEPDEVRGDAIWKKISGAIRIEGRPDDLRFFNHFLRRTPEPRLSGGGGKARFEVEFDHGIGKGAGDFQFTRAAFRYPEGTVAGRAAGRLAIPRWDVENGNLDVSGSRVELTGVTTEGTRHDERDWWGRFEIVSGRFHGDFAAQTSVACRDARPLYTLFAAKLPGWAEGLLKMEGIQATGRVRLGSRSVEVENLEASGGKFTIAGRYRDRKDVRDGAFLLETGILAVGVSIEGDQSHVKLLGARKWFEGAGAAPARPSSDR